MTVTDLTLLLASGLAAGFINALSGGGAMLTLPAFIFVGLPPSVANGTNRLAVAIQCVASVAAYQRFGVIDYRLALSAAVPATLGGLCGALVSVQLEDALFRTILAITMLLLIGPIIAEPKLRVWVAARAQRLQSGWFMWGLFFALGMYGGLMQVGVGVFLLVALSTVGGIDLVAANGAKVVVVLCLTVLALVVFLAEGKVDWPAGLLMASANAVGSWFGAHWGVRKGDYWIRIVLVGTVIVMAFQLLGVPAWMGRVLL